MASGIQNAGSIAKESGISFETLAAAVGKVSEVTRQDGSQVGNQLKTMMARISRAKDADSDVTAEDRSDAAEALKKYANIDLYDASGNYKDLTVTLDETAAAWDKLTDAQRANVAEAFGGVRGVNSVRVLLDNWKEVRNLAGDALSDTDFYQEVQAKSMDSLQSKMDTFDAASKDFFHNLIDNDLVSSGISAVTGLENALSGLFKVFSQFKGISGLGYLGLLMGGSAILGGWDMGLNKFRDSGGTAAFLPTIGKSIAQQFKAIPTMGIAMRNKDAFKSLFDGTGMDLSWGKAFKAGIQAYKESGGNTPVRDIVKTMEGNKIAESYMNTLTDGDKPQSTRQLMRGLTDETADFGDKAKASWGAFRTGMGTAWKSLGGFTKTMLGVGAAVSAFELGKKVIDAFSVNTEEAKTKVENLNSAMKEDVDKSNSLKAFIDSDSGRRLGELSDLRKESGGLNTAQLKEYNDLVNQIADISPELVSGYDAQNNAILKISGSLASLNAEYDKMLANQARQRMSEAEDRMALLNYANGNKGWAAEIEENAAGMWNDFTGNSNKQDKLNNIDNYYGGGRIQLYKDLKEANKQAKEGKYFSRAELRDIINSQSADTVYGEILGLDVKGKNDQEIERIVNEAFQNGEMQSAIATLEATMNDGMNEFRQLMYDQISIKVNDGTSAVSTKVVSDLQSFIAKLPVDAFNFEEGTEIDASFIRHFIDNATKQLQESPSLQKALDDLLSYDPAKGIESVESIEAIVKAINELSEALNIDTVSLSEAFGLADVDKTATALKNFSSTVKSVYSKENRGKYVEERMKGKSDAEIFQGFINASKKPKPIKLSDYTPDVYHKVDTKEQYVSDLAKDAQKQSEKMNKVYWKSYNEKLVRQHYKDTEMQRNQKMFEDIDDFMAHEGKIKAPKYIPIAQRKQESADRGKNKAKIDNANEPLFIRDSSEHKNAYELQEFKTKSKANIEKTKAERLAREKYYHDLVPALEDFSHNTQQYFKKGNPEAVKRVIDEQNRQNFEKSGNKYKEEFQNLPDFEKGVFKTNPYLKELEARQNKVESLANEAAKQSEEYTKKQIIDTKTKEVAAQNKENTKSDYLSLSPIERDKTTNEILDYRLKALTNIKNTEEERLAREKYYHDLVPALDDFNHNTQQYFKKGNPEAVKRVVDEQNRQNFEKSGNKYKAENQNLPDFEKSTVKKSPYLKQLEERQDKIESLSNDAAKKSEAFTKKQIQTQNADEAARRNQEIATRNKAERRSEHKNLPAFERDANTNEYLEYRSKALQNISESEKNRLEREKYLRDLVPALYDFNHNTQQYFRKGNSEAIKMVVDEQNRRNFAKSGEKFKADYQNQSIYERDKDAKLLLLRQEEEKELNRLIPEFRKLSDAAKSDFLQGDTDIIDLVVERQNKANAEKAKAKAIEDNQNLSDKYQRSQTVQQAEDARIDKILEKTGMIADGIEGRSPVQKSSISVEELARSKDLESFRLLNDAIGRNYGFENQMVNSGQVIQGINQIAHNTKLANELKEEEAKSKKKEEQVKYTEGDFNYKKDDRFGKLLSGEELSKHGYNIHKSYQDGYFAQTFTSDDGSRSVVMTPVLPNGEILGKDELQTYANALLAGDDIDVKDITLGMWEGKNSVRQAKEFQKSLHKASKEFQNIDSDLADFIRQAGFDSAAAIEEAMNAWKNAMADDISFKDFANDYLQKLIDTDKNQTRIDDLWANTSKFKQDLQTVQSARNEAHTSTGLSKANLDALDKVFANVKGYDKSKMFGLSAAEGIKINEQEFKKIDKAWKTQQLEKYTDTVGSLEAQYRAVCSAIGEANGMATADQFFKRDTLKKQIEEAKMAQAEFEGLTNAVTQFKNASSETQVYADYQYVQGKQQSMDELNNKGLFGNTEYQKYVEMFTSPDVDTSGWTGQEYANAYAEASKKAKRYFQEDMRFGVKNFFDDLTAAGDTFATGSMTEGWQVKASAQDIAKQLKISDAAVDEMFNALQGLGVPVEFTVDSPFKALKDEAREAAKTIGLDFDEIDVNGKSFEDVSKKLEECKKKRDELDDKGAPEWELDAWNKQIEYLTSCLGELVKDYDIDMNINVHEDREKLDGYIKKLNELDGDKKLTVDLALDTTNLDRASTDLKNFENYFQKNFVKDGKIDLSVDGAPEAMNVLIALKNHQEELARPVILSVNTNNLDSNAGPAIEKMKQLVQAKQDLDRINWEIKMGIRVENDGTVEQAKEQIRQTVRELKEQAENGNEISSKILAHYGLDVDMDETELNNKIDQLANKDIETINKDLNVNLNVDGQENDKELQVGADTSAADKAIQSLYTKWDGKEVKMKATIEDSDSKTPEPTVGTNNSKAPAKKDAGSSPILNPSTKRQLTVNGYMNQVKPATKPDVGVGKSTIKVESDLSSYNSGVSRAVSQTESQKPSIDVDSDTSSATGKAESAANEINGLNPLINIDADGDGAISEAEMVNGFIASLVPMMLILGNASGAITSASEAQMFINSIMALMGISADSEQAQQAGLMAKSIIEGNPAQMSVTANVTDATTKADGAKGTIDNKQGTIKVNADTQQAISSANNVVSTINGKTATVRVLATGLDAIISKLSSIQSKTITVTTYENTVKNKYPGTALVNKSNTVKTGTGKTTKSAYAWGSARAGGDWGVKNPGRTLVGELNPELIFLKGQYKIH